MDKPFGRIPDSRDDSVRKISENQPRRKFKIEALTKREINDFEEGIYDGSNPISEIMKFMTECGEGSEFKISIIE